MACLCVLFWCTYRLVPFDGGTGAARWDSDGQRKQHQRNGDEADAAARELRARVRGTR